MKKVVLKQVRYEDRGLIIDFLENNHEYKASRKIWENLFYHNWSEEDNFGYCLINKEKVVGYFGIIFSDNKIYKDYQTANIHSWVVKKEYRPYSLKLLRHIMTMNKVFLTSHSTINKILKIYYRYGWKNFEEFDYYLFDSFTIFNRKKIKILSSNIDKIFPPEELKKIEDHIKYNCNFYLLDDENSKIFIIGKIKKNLFINYFEIIYISNISQFNKIFYRYINSLKKITKTTYIKVDSRFISDCNKIIKLKRKKKNYKKIYFFQPDDKSINFSDINNLYSEIFLLDT